MNLDLRWSVLVSLCVYVPAIVFVDFRTWHMHMAMWHVHTCAISLYRTFTEHVMWPVWLYKATLCSDSELGWVDDRGCQSHSHHAHCDACGPGNPWSAAGLLLLSFKAVRAQRHLGDTRIKNWLAALRVWCLRVILAWQYGRCLKRINLCIQHTAPSASHRWEHPEVPKCEILRPLRAPLPGFLSAQGWQRPWPPLPVLKSASGQGIDVGHGSKIGQNCRLLDLNRIWYVLKFSDYLNHHFF